MSTAKKVDQYAQLQRQSDFTFRSSKANELCLCTVANIFGISKSDAEEQLERLVLSSQRNADKISSVSPVSMQQK